MSAHYTTEPPPSATVVLHTTAGPLTLSLFATQTPLTCRNFLQHCLDGTYASNLFHRVSPGFVIQTGDPSGTGSGGQNIYEDAEFEHYDEAWARVMGREKGERIIFGDELHSRLKFNRRGLIGMAKAEGGYGSQFFVTLGDCRAELDGKCTMFGRVEGDGIYNVVKVAEGELVEGTERPVFPEKIVKVEVLEMPKGEAWEAMKPRVRVAERVVEQQPAKKKAGKKAKGGKVLLSFGDEEGQDADVVVKPKKAKFNTALIDATGPVGSDEKTNGTANETKGVPSRQKPRSPSPDPVVPRKRKASPLPPHAGASEKAASPQPQPHRRKPSLHDPSTQLPLKDPESPSRSPTPSSPPPPPRNLGPSTSALESEIAALKASMRRPTTAPSQSKPQKSALEALIPATSTRGRKRPRPGTTSKNDAAALAMLSAFKARLDTAAPSNDADTNPSTTPTNQDQQPHETVINATTDGDDEEAALCDLHFIANCQSCSNWDQREPADTNGGEEGNEDDKGWMGHQLSFEKDRLGKDLNWRKKNEDDLVVIDPREREKELGVGVGGKGKGRDKDAQRRGDRNRERDRRRERM